MKETNLLADSSSALECLLGEYRQWLELERGLAVETVRCYLTQSRKFLTSLPGSPEASLATLGPGDVIAYVRTTSVGSGSIWSVKTQVTALRSFLRFGHVCGLIPVALAPVVPAVAGWRLSQVPRGLPASDVDALLECHDVATCTGLRDKAVLTLLADLGLRGSEAAGLDLDDVDWRAGLITVTGKGSCTEQLPLPARAGEALAKYVMKGRPTGTGCTALFLTARGHTRQLSPGAIRQIMRRACERAGITAVGAHRLRHTLATELLRAGSSLPEIGQVLRHRSQLATAIYAKVDYGRLRELARPWPEAMVRSAV